MAFKYCIDSRKVEKGDIFVAIKGERVDGHDFLDEAASKGAASAIIDRTYSGKKPAIPLLPVDNVLETLQSLAQKKIEKLNPRIIAITGSVGKTTTKDFITTLLKAKWEVGSTKGNHNSQIGLPLSLLNNFNETHPILVLEMGMDQPGQIRRLVKIAPPEIALITSVELVHAANFHSLKEIALAKGEIFSHPKTQKGILPQHIAYYDTLCQLGTCKKVPFSITEEDSSLLNSFHLPGKHNLHNYVAAIAVARQMGMSKDEILEASKELRLPERRFQVQTIKGITFINDAYNASLASIKAALQSLPQPTPGRKKIAALGGMLELGKFSEECHREVGEFSLSLVDEMLCLGQECRPIVECWQKADRPVFWAKTREEIVKKLRKDLCAGDVVLLKGSRAKEMDKIIDDRVWT